MRWLRWEALGVTGVVIVIAATIVASSARAYTVGPPSESLICGSEASAQLAVVENFLSPANGLTVAVGSPITLSSVSSQPLSFAIASSAALLSTPNLDSGPGSPGPPPANAAGSELYSFTSTKASASAGTVYWQASFSTAEMPHCAEYVRTETTAVRTLTVLPAPAPAPTPPAQTPSVPTVTPDLTPPAPVRINIGSKRFQLAHPTVTYTVKCDERCTGNVEYDVVVHHRRKVDRVHWPTLASKAFSIQATAGGEQQLSYRFTGSALRLLKRLAQEGDAIAMDLRASARPVESGAITHAQCTVSLSA
jgi:hypothetical protein